MRLKDCVNPARGVKPARYLSWMRRLSGDWRKRYSILWKRPIAGSELPLLDEVAIERCKYAHTLLGTDLDNEGKPIAYLGRETGRELLFAGTAFPTLSGKPRQELQDLRVHDAYGIRQWSRLIRGSRKDLPLTA